MTVPGTFFSLPSIYPLPAYCRPVAEYRKLLIIPRDVPFSFFAQRMIPRCIVYAERNANSCSFLIGINLFYSQLTEHDARF